MKRLSTSHPLSIAQEVLQGRKLFDALDTWPQIKIDTAISMVLDESLPARRRAKGTEVLSNTDDPACEETCEYLLETSHSSLVKQAAISPKVRANLLKRRVELDPSYIVRRKALAALPSDFPLASIRTAASDPHWRVRMALVERIEETNQVAEAIDWNESDRETGFASFLRWRQEANELPAINQKQNPFGWDDDPAVLLAELKKQPREQWLKQLPFLINHSGEKVRSWAVQRMLEFGTSELCDEAANRATDPRHPGWTAVEQLVNRLDADRRPDWNPVEPLVTAWSENHPVNRVCSDPEKETCWLVLRKYLNQNRILVEQILPAPIVAEPVPQLPGIELVDREPDAIRIAVSGHYLLPTEQFAVAFERGIDHFFWEHNYGTFNRFVLRLSPSDRTRLRMIAGTFEAEPKKIAKDIDNALRILKIDCLDVFLLFWSRSTRRFSEEVLSLLESAKTSGKIRQFGLSTHQWQLAHDQIELGWNPVMVRHNLAHRSAEKIVFPKAAENDTRIFSFNTTCYGRLLKEGMSARDCIRYSLHQAEIDLILTAPSTAEQLDENLSAMDAPELTASEIAAWQKIGDSVYQNNKAFYNGLQSRT